MSPQSLTDERRSRLLELVRVRGFASLPDLAGELEVSESTVRRDLDHLEANGVEPIETDPAVFRGGTSGADRSAAGQARPDRDLQTAIRGAGPGGRAGHSRTGTDERGAGRQNDDRHRGAKGCALDYC